MVFQDITSADAIVSAIREFDKLGRDVFLKKYGFGPARSFFLQLDGKQYDSKAILGAAHAYQFGSPLTSGDFVGGEQTVARKLEKLGFEVARLSADDVAEDDPPIARNPKWNRDELIIALAAYVKWEGNPPGKESVEIAELSQFLNDLCRSLGTPTTETLRNSNGVYMKLMNFRRFDPKYAEQGKVGLSRGGRLEEEIWTTFYADPARLQRTADAIRLATPTPDQTAPDGAVELADHDDLTGMVEADEGRVLSVLHLRRERSLKLARAKKDQALRENGKLECEVCRFDFHAAYGEHGKGFIECHHVRPLQSLAGSTKTRLDDLALLCANCHRMVHARRPWLSLEGLREVRQQGPLC